MINYESIGRNTFAEIDDSIFLNFAYDYTVQNKRINIMMSLLHAADLFSSHNIVPLQYVSKIIIRN